VSDVFAALADPGRRHLLEQLAARGEATATELAAELPITRQAVAKHLGTLACADLVASTRAGRELRFRLTPAPLADAAAWLASVGGAWDARLQALAAYLERSTGTSDSVETTTGASGSSGVVSSRKPV
jgi:predicted ArsR family transcriptional regulator